MAPLGAPPPRSPPPGGLNSREIACGPYKDKVLYGTCSMHLQSPKYGIEHANTNTHATHAWIRVDRTMVNAAASVHGTLVARASYSPLDSPRRVLLVSSDFELHLLPAAPVVAVADHCGEEERAERLGRAQIPQQRHGRSRREADGQLHVVQPVVGNADRPGYGRAVQSKVE
eukprot:scaffold81704_cov66-Phaeocystis_antarctica.AAC.3